MCRLVFGMLLGVLLISGSGCRSKCGSRQALAPAPGPTPCSSMSGVPYTLTGGGRMQEGCFDPVTGQPVPCPPPTTVIPGGTYPPPMGSVSPPNELPYPSPSTIPPPGVPYAPPMAAPGSEGASAMPKGTTPVKANPKQ
jgi:hypothetical protein